VPATVEGGRFTLTAEAIESAITPASRVILLNSPWNPVGTMLRDTELREIGELAVRRNLTIISDEIYEAITYEGRRHRSPAALSDDVRSRTIIVNSLSKTYAMTGWRLGWMLVPPELARAVECLAQNFYVSPPALSQLAAPAAFGCRAGLDAHVARYRTNRDLLIAMLKEAGLDRFAPAEGAFYLYVDVSDICASGLIRDSQELCRRMLDETGVATTPGRDFDPLHGDDWLRLSFAGPTADIAEAARRLGVWLKRAG
jgi:aspartate/methionine/tyrosine aminotransferase